MSSTSTESERCSIGRGRRNHNYFKCCKIFETGSKCSDENSNIDKRHKYEIINSSHSPYRPVIDGGSSHLIAKITYPNIIPKFSNEQRKEQQFHPQHINQQQNESDTEECRIFNNQTPKLYVKEKEFLGNISSIGVKKKTMNWKDRRKESAHQSYKSYLYSNGTDCSEIEASSSKERKPRPINVKTESDRCNIRKDRRNHETFKCCMIKETGSKCSDESSKIDKRRKYEIINSSHSPYNRPFIDGGSSHLIAKISYSNIIPKFSNKKREAQQVHPQHIDHKKQNGCHTEGYRIFNKQTTYVKGKEFLDNISSKGVKKKTMNSKDPRKDSAHQRYKSYLHSNEADYSEIEQPNRQERKPRPINLKKHHKISKPKRDEKYPKHIPKIRVSRSNLRSRSRSKFMRTKKNIRVRHRRRSQSDNIRYEAFKNLPRQRKRSHSSIPGIKYIPLKYQRNKAKREKKSDGRDIFDKQIEYKKPFKLDKPPVITLYPKNQKGKEMSYHKLERSFFEDPLLPCKCFLCKKKYVQLVSLKQEIQELKLNRKANETPNCVQPKKILYQPQICQKYIPDWWCSDSMPVINDYVIPKCNAFKYCNEPTFYKKNVNFKFHSFRQRLDPNITEYFHSILEQMNYC